MRSDIDDNKTEYKNTFPSIINYLNEHTLSLVFFLLLELIYILRLLESSVDDNECLKKEKKKS